MRTLKFLPSLLFAVGVAASALADDACPPAQFITSVDMRMGNDGRIYVPVSVNDAKRSMLVDTGGFFSELTQQTANELNLPTRKTRLELIGVGGDTTNIATRASFALGNLRADAADFMVIPDASGFADDVSDVAGILAPNLLHSYDLDIDFSAMKFSLLSQDHCDGKAVRWSGAMAVLPMRVDTSDHIQIPVQLDGQELVAILDTGATKSVLNLELAKSTFGLTPGDADTPEVGRLLRSPESKTYSHRFKSLSLEGIAIADPTVRLIPDLMRNKMKDPRASLEGGSRLSSSIVKPGFGDLILGMNVLRQWHIYIAYKEQKLYLTHAPAPAFVEVTTTTEATAAVQMQPMANPPKPPDNHPH